MPKDVFICHSSKDAEVAGALVEALEADGASCWIAPRDVEAGAVWAASIEGAIESAKVMLILVSNEANESKHVLREVERGVANDCRIAAVRLADVQLSKALEYFLGTVHWVDMLDHEEPAARTRVAGQILAAMHSKKIETAPARRASASVGGAAAWFRRPAVLVGAVLALAVAGVLWAALSGDSEGHRPPGIDMAITLGSTEHAVPERTLAGPQDPDDWKPRYAEEDHGGTPLITARVPARERQRDGELNTRTPPASAEWPVPVLRLTVDNRTPEGVVVVGGRVTVTSVKRTSEPLFLVVANEANVLEIHNVTGAAATDARLSLAKTPSGGCEGRVLDAAGTFVGTPQGAFRLDLREYAPPAGSTQPCLAGTLRWKDAGGTVRALPLRQRVTLKAPEGPSSFAPSNATFTKPMMAPDPTDMRLRAEVDAISHFQLSQSVAANDTFVWDVRLRAPESAVYDIDIELLGFDSQVLAKRSVRIEVFTPPRLMPTFEEWWSKTVAVNAPKTKGN